MLNFDNLLEGIVVTVIGGIILALIVNVTIYIIKKLTPTSIPNSTQNSNGKIIDKAVYLNSPRNILNYECIGRDTTLNTIYNHIKNNISNNSVRDHILITGEEGIGKTLLCQTLFRYKLKNLNIYLGWIECNGKQSIYDIINNTFNDLKFFKKDKNKLLDIFQKLDKPCILFIDQVDQYTPIDELNELSFCGNITLVISGVIKSLNFIKNTIKLSPLKEKYILKIFEDESNECLILMDATDKKAIKCIIEEYVNGNPFLAVALASAKYFYNGKWDQVLENMRRREYTEEDYIKNILKQLYNLSSMNKEDKLILAKLSTFSFYDYVELIFQWLDIPLYNIEHLCNTYWMKHDEYLLYSMDEIHYKVISKVFLCEEDYYNTMIAFYNSIKNSKMDSNDFIWFAMYAEDILRKIKAHAPDIMEEEKFSYFAYEVASNYNLVNNKRKGLEWIELCKPGDVNLALDKDIVEARLKSKFVDILYTNNEIGYLYESLLIKIQNLKDPKISELYILQEYCNFLNRIEEYIIVIYLCNAFFSKNIMDLNDEDTLTLYCRYLFAANKIDDKETLNLLVNDRTITCLFENKEKFGLVVAWCFSIISHMYKKQGNIELYEKYLKQMVILLNKSSGFFCHYVKEYMNISEEDFSEYMHSCDELLESLKSALLREDPEALYIEGRYCEKHGDLEQAFILYEKAASKNSLRGMCSLALLYYRGEVETRDVDKAYNYWKYCCDRGHSGSYYWMGILYLDTTFKKYNRNIALTYLKKAAELGSKRAQQKLMEI